MKISAPIKFNDEIEECINKNGYAVIDLLTNDEVFKFLKLWEAIPKEVLFDNYCSILSTDIEFNKSVNSLLINMFRQKIEKIVQNVMPIQTGSVLIKRPSEKAVVFPHLDPTIVDESIYSSFNVWIPMIDVDENNGCLYLYNDYLAISEKYRKRPINNTIVQYYEELSHFWENSIPINLKAGQALIFNHKLPHASKGNYTHNDRIAVSLSLIPENAKLVMYYQNEKLKKWNMIEKYIVDYSSFFERDNNGKPKKYISKNIENQIPFSDFIFLNFKNLFNV
jgi:ectoine hydroxylase-related dioxygenase (phytanoyl-CoA dioxygenase family)